MKVLVINAGSSSLKYQLMDPTTREVFAKGLCERIGIDGRLTHKVPAKDAKYEFEIPMPTHSEAIQAVLDALLDAGHGVIKSASEIDAVGHRVVHGGEKFASSVRITDEVMAALEECIPLAPLHNPANITGIKACEKVMPGVPMVGVFDTAFHQTMPAKSYIYALPYEFYEQDKVRRYGFHGTSHEYVSHVAADMLGIARDEFNGIVAHLGNGASVTAVKGGKSVDTSMGYTPLAGLIMGTRSGDIDPSALTTILIREGIDGARLDTILNKESGLLALAGSNDMRKVVEAAQSGDERAQLALDMTSYRLMKYIGGYNLVVGGAQALIFTAGIGENSGDFRKLVLDRLGALGIKYNEEENAKRSPEPRVISTEDSAIKVLVIPTNEEKAIAEATEELVKSL